MKDKEYIAYSGSEYVVEWFYNETGESKVLDYVMDLSPLIQQKLFYLIKRIADNGKINDLTKFRNEGDKIYAFKPQPYRFLSFFVKDKKIIITNGFKKKTDKIPINEKEKAIEYRENYFRRINNGDYYE